MLYVHLLSINTPKGTMFILFFISNVVTISAAPDQEPAVFFNLGPDTRNNRGLSNVHDAFSKQLLHNSTYVDKEENLLRVPKKYYDESKIKKKIKKAPKRTVQKIIKKNKFKTRKIYLFPVTSIRTLTSKSEYLDDTHTRYAVTTTDNNVRKKQRKNSKYVRYPMPFQKLQRREGSHSRYRREDRNVYILRDFDEMEFLSNEKDHDKVLTHVQNYW